MYTSHRHRQADSRLLALAPSRRVRAHRPSFLAALPTYPQHREASQPGSICEGHAFPEGFRAGLHMGAAPDRRSKGVRRPHREGKYTGAPGASYPAAEMQEPGAYTGYLIRIPGHCSPLSRGQPKINNSVGSNLTAYTHCTALVIMLPECRCGLRAAGPALRAQARAVSSRTTRHDSKQPELRGGSSA